MDGMGAADGGDAGLGKTEEPYFSLFDQITDRAGHFLDRHGPIDAMLIEQVDVVRAQPPQATFHRLKDMLGPAVDTDDSVALEPGAKLRGDRYLTAPPFERPAKQLFVGKRAIVLRRVEEGASQFDRAMQCGDRLGFIRRSVKLT